MNKRIRKKHEKELNNQKLTRGGDFTSLKSKVSHFDKKWLAISLTVIAVFILAIFVKASYAYLYQTLRGEKSYSLKVKGFSLKLDDSSTSENIKIENSVPVSDEVGKKNTAYTFSIINEDTSDTGYVLYLDDVSIDNEINRMKDTNMKYQLIENGKEKVGLVSELGTSPFRILTNGVINGKKTNTYSLRFWIKEDAEIATGQIFNVKIRVIATSKEAIEEGKLVFGETVVTSDSGITTMTSDELQTYVDKALGNKIQTELDKQAQEYETKLNEKGKEILNKNHPVGSIYITETNQNPSEIFGGTWQAYATGRTLVGIDSSNASFNTIGKTGGNPNGKVTLTTAQLPTHNHAYTPSGSIKSTFSGTSVTTNTTGSHTHHALFFAVGNGTVTIPANEVYITETGKNTTFNWSTTPISNQIEWYFSTTSSGNHSHTVTAAGTVASTFTGTKSTTENTGSTAAVSTQDPYITVYMWKRIS